MIVASWTPSPLRATSRPGLGRVEVDSAVVECDYAQMVREIKSQDYSFRYEMECHGKQELTAEEVVGALRLPRLVEARHRESNRRFSLVSPSQLASVHELLCDPTSTDLVILREFSERGMLHSPERDFVNFRNGSHLYLHQSLNRPSAYVVKSSQELRALDYLVGSGQDRGVSARPQLDRLRELIDHDLLTGPRAFKGLTSHDGYGVGRDDQTRLIVRGETRLGRHCYD